MRVLFIWEVREELRNYLLAHLLKSKSMEFIFLTKDELEMAAIERPEDIQVTVGWVVQRPFWDKIFRQLTHLQLIIHPAVGVDKAIPFVQSLHSNHKITLCNSFGHTYFTAQHAVGMLLTLCNRLLLHHHAMKVGKWRTGEKDGKSLPMKYRKTGLLGYGSINQRVHRFLEGFDTEIHVLKNTLTEAQQTDPHFYTQDQLHDFLAAVDNLILAVPLTEKTNGMIGEKELELLGASGILVNVARGEVVQEKPFYEALKTGKIFAAASDVWYDYRPEADEEGRKFPYTYPFHELENVLLSPHRGGSPLDDLERWGQTMEILSRFERKEELMNVINWERGY